MSALSEQGNNAWENRRTRQRYTTHPYPNLAISERAHETGVTADLDPAADLDPP